MRMNVRIWNKIKCQGMPTNALLVERSCRLWCYTTECHTHCFYKILAFLSTQCILFVRSVCFLSTQCLLFTRALIALLSARCLLFVCTMLAFCLHNACFLSAQCLLFVCTMLAFCLHNACFFVDAMLCSF